MRPLLAQVDRLQRLAVFDAAARSGTFTAAAAELSTSQPAVTRQIRELELALGVTLFNRSANRATLSDAGQRLALAIDNGFTTIERSVAELWEPDPMFVVAAPPGFAQQLIVPALDRLHDSMPDVDIRLWLYDRDDDLDAGNFDIAVRIGTGGWPGVDDIELFPERVIPVATETLAEELGLHAQSTPTEVLAAPLLHMEADGRTWMSWEHWLETFGLSLTPGRRRVIHNSYPIVIQQALAGRGIALGWRSIVEQLLDDRLLVTVGPEVASEQSYRLTWPSNTSNPELLRVATTWALDLTSVAGPPADS